MFSSFARCRFVHRKTVLSTNGANQIQAVAYKWHGYSTQTPSRIDACIRRPLTLIKHGGAHWLSAVTWSRHVTAGPRVHLSSKTLTSPSFGFSRRRLIYRSSGIGFAFRSLVPPFRDRRRRPHTPRSYFLGRWARSVTRRVGAEAADAWSEAPRWILAAGRVRMSRGSNFRLATSTRYYERLHDNIIYGTRSISCDRRSSLYSDDITASARRLTRHFMSMTLSRRRLAAFQRQHRPPLTQQY